MEFDQQFQFRHQEIHEMLGQSLEFYFVRLALRFGSVCKPPGPMMITPEAGVRLTLFPVAGPEILEWVFPCLMNIPRVSVPCGLRITLCFFNQAKMASRDMSGSAFLYPYLYNIFQIMDNQSNSFRNIFFFRILEGYQ